MNVKSLNRLNASAVLLATLPCLVLLSVGHAWAREQSAAAIIQDLTYQSGRPAGGGVFGCASFHVETRENRRIADSLAALGDSALPEIDNAITSVEQDGIRSRFAPNAGWLLYAFAKIKGTAAYPRLRGLVGEPKLGFLQDALRNSISVALSLTSYVDSARPPQRALCRDAEPRDALTQLIFAWETSDLQRLQSSLGTDAERALDLLLKGTNWGTFRARVSHNKAEGGVIGYRLAGSGSWFEPEGASDAEATKPHAGGMSGLFEIDTLFKDRSGNICGDRRLKFREVSVQGTHFVKYLVDNPDLADVLSLVASCSTDGDKRP